MPLQLDEVNDMVDVLSGRIGNAFAGLGLDVDLTHTQNFGLERWNVDKYNSPELGKAVELDGVGTLRGSVTGSFDVNYDELVGIDIGAAMAITGSLQCQLTATNLLRDESRSAQYSGSMTVSGMLTLRTGATVTANVGMFGLESYSLSSQGSVSPTITGTASPETTTISVTANDFVIGLTLTLRWEEDRTTTIPFTLSPDYLERGITVTGPGYGAVLQ
jgi:hypothetical protein